MVFSTRAWAINNRLVSCVMDFERPSQVESQTLSDTNLWLALRNGQVDALGCLYDRHASLVYGLALKVLGNRQEAEDLTQDIFLTLAKKAGYDPSRGSLRTYLAILTRSRAIDRMRSRKTAQSLIERSQINVSEEKTTNSPFDYAFANERSQQVQVALAELSSSQRQILQMAYLEGFTQAKIAELLEIPLGTVKARARRGLLKLRQILQMDGD
ncbi:sigma-70 family RNA polymerase sigma factor [Calothrix sp. PCC 7507]|uniref:sigma-70 family RNA polymerase sigma factor n=1 Tax=Calothrix sp. PCC 7507 TaxID=99598 RepID=UPI00029ECC59|nr:sigma-70 family RNA polymerase sigma factor [Calothrix sp. PCC 7507]AFY30614.1 RNA polymerase, sigma-24 subunit, ECF subfamily [Calothrix sp. PCC 7507]